MGEALGQAGVSVEGGGVFVAGGVGVAHFLFVDGHAARRLRQDEPGQLGKIARRMAEAGVNIEVQYSDHDHQLILVVDDLAKGRAAADAWTRESAGA
jgi:prepilin-type processing-associated H-X9-DG protein